MSRRATGSGKPSSGRSPRGDHGRVRGFERIVFRLLLRAYGCRFRRRYEKELLSFFEQDRSRDRYAGLSGGFRFWRRTLKDLSTAAVRDRTTTLPRDPFFMIREMLFELRVSCRGLAKNPGFTAVAVLTLGVGLTATTLVYGFVSAALIEPLPFPDATEIVVIQGTTVTDRGQVRSASYPEIQEWASRTRTFSGMGAFSQVSVNLVTGDAAERIAAEVVDPSYFAVLGADPLIGRLFGDQENVAQGAHPVALISESLWQRRFAGDRTTLGSTIFINGRELVVVGILPQEFGGVSLRTELWLPAMMASLVGRDGALANPSQRWMAAIARLREGVAAEAAQADVDAIAHALAAESPANYEDRTGTLTPLRDLYLGATRDTLVALMVAALVLLAVAAANIAGLLLVRATDQGTELALRRALGSGRSRLIRRVLLDSLAISALGSTLALLISVWAIEIITASLPQGALPAYAQPRLDPRTFALAAATLVATALVAGALPALRASRIDLSGALRAARSVGAGAPRRLSPQQILVVSEVALATVLLIATGLLAQTFAAKLAVAPGFDAGRLTAFRLAPPQSAYDGDSLRAFVTQLQERLESLPEVEAASYGSDLPLRGDTSAGFLRLEPDSEESVRYYRHRVPPGYMATAGIRLLRGRDFSASDRRGAPRVALVSAELASRYLGGAEALDTSIWLGQGDAATEVRVVGVVETVRWRDLTTDLTGEDSNPDVYFPFDQSPARSLEVIVRSRVEEARLLPRIRESVSSLDAELPLFQTVQLADLLDQQTASDRLAALAFALFGGAALLLAAVGVYGTISYSVGRRGRELALRAALGATAGRVRRVVIGQGLSLATGGIVVGCGAAVAFNRFLRALLFGVSPVDPSTFLAVVFLLAAVGFAATAIPAFRATRISPYDALKSE